MEETKVEIKKEPEGVIKEELRRKPKKDQRK